MQQQRNQKPPVRPADRAPRDPNTTHLAGQQPAEGMDRDAETREALIALTGMVERLTEKVEAMQEARPGQGRMAHIGGRIDRLLSGRFISLLAAASSMITVVTLFSSQNLGLLKRLPVSAGAIPAWTPAAFIRPLIPEAIALALVAILIPASGLLKRTSRRIKFLTSLMVCYGAATVLYLAWLSLSFLHYNTLPGGVLLALTWVGIVSILRRASAEVSEMRELIRVQLEKEAQQGKIIVPPPPPRSA